MIQYEVEFILWDGYNTSHLVVIAEIESPINQTAAAMNAGLLIAKSFVMPHIEISINGCRKLK